MDLDQARNAHHDILAARLVVVPGAWHMVLVEQPHAGTTAITEFIQVEAA